jgi:hypothetical protein
MKSNCTELDELTEGRPPRATAVLMWSAEAGLRFRIRESDPSSALRAPSPLAEGRRATDHAPRLKLDEHRLK